MKWCRVEWCGAKNKMDKKMYKIRVNTLKIRSLKQLEKGMQLPSPKGSFHRSEGASRKTKEKVVKKRPRNKKQILKIIGRFFK